MDIKLVIFDMDGVIFEGGNFWLDLHRHFGTEKEGVEFANRYMSSDYDTLARLVAGGLWRGKPAAIFDQLIAQRRYHPGVDQVFAALRRWGLRTAILSSGPYQLALRAQKELGIDLIRANRLVIENGIIQGDVEVMVPDAEKARVGLEMMAELDVEPAQTAFVGDSDSDVELARMVGLPVAYNARSEKLLATCKFALEYGQLPRLLEIIREGGKDESPHPS